jgi:hypothetical protein
MMEPKFNKHPIAQDDESSGTRMLGTVFIVVACVALCFVLIAPFFRVMP